MSALKDLLNSSRGLIAIVLIVAVSVLAAMQIATFLDWKEYTLYIFGFFTAGNTLSNVATTIANRPATAPSPAATPAASASVTVNPASA